MFAHTDTPMTIERIPESGYASSASGGKQPARHQTYIKHWNIALKFPLCRHVGDSGACESKKMVSGARESGADAKVRCSDAFPAQVTRPRERK